MPQAHLAIPSAADEGAVAERGDRPDIAFMCRFGILIRERGGEQDISAHDIFGPARYRCTIVPHGMIEEDDHANLRDDRCGGEEIVAVIVESGLAASELMVGIQIYLAGEPRSLSGVPRVRPIPVHIERLAMRISAEAEALIAASRRPHSPIGICPRLEHMLDALEDVCSKSGIIEDHAVVIPIVLRIAVCHGNKTYGFGASY